MSYVWKGIPNIHSRRFKAANSQLSIHSRRLKDVDSLPLIHSRRFSVENSKSPVHGCGENSQPNIYNRIFTADCPQPGNYRENFSQNTAQYKGANFTPFGTRPDMTQRRAKCANPDKQGNLNRYDTNKSEIHKSGQTREFISAHAFGPDRFDTNKTGIHESTQ